MPGLAPARLSIDELARRRCANRPQLLGLKTHRQEPEGARAARRDNYRISTCASSTGSGKKDLEGMPRVDLFTLTVAFKPAVWGATEDRGAGKIGRSAGRLREQADQHVRRPADELVARLRQQAALVEAKAAIRPGSSRRAFCRRRG